MINRLVSVAAVINGYSLHSAWIHIDLLVIKLYFLLVHVDILVSLIRILHLLLNLLFLLIEMILILVFDNTHAEGFLERFAVEITLTNLKKTTWEHI